MIWPTKNCKITVPSEVIFCRVIFEMWPNWRALFGRKISRFLQTTFVRSAKFENGLLLTWTVWCYEKQTCSLHCNPFQEQGQSCQGLPYEEKALLLAIAFSWYAKEKEQTVVDTERKSMDTDGNADQAKEIKLNQLEKQVWLLRIREEVSKKGSVSNTVNRSLNHQSTYY